MLFGKKPEEMIDSPMLHLLGSGFTQSLDMVAAALGVELDPEKRTHHAFAVAKQPIDSPIGPLQPGTVAAQRFAWEGTVRGEPFVSARTNWFMGDEDLDPAWNFGPEGERFEIEITGDPGLKATFHGLHPESIEAGLQRNPRDRRHGAALRERDSRNRPGKARNQDLSRPSCIRRHGRGSSPRPGWLKRTPGPPRVRTLPGPLRLRTAIRYPEPAPEESVRMPYAHRPIHDADAHVMEAPDWLAPHADPPVRERLAERTLGGLKPGERELFDEFRARHADPEYRSRDEAELMTRKNWAATGSFVKEDRPLALDLLGFRSQLIFNTFLNGQMLVAERADDIAFGYGFARAHNRAMVEFCSADPRLLATGYVPLRDFERSKALARESLDMGCAALLVPSGCPRGHAPSHSGLDSVWAQAQEAGRPVVFHVGGGLRLADNQLLDLAYFENGGPAIPDFPRRRRELPLGGLHGHPDRPPCRPWPR